MLSSTHFAHRRKWPPVLNVGNSATADVFSLAGRQPLAHQPWRCAWPSTLFAMPKVATSDRRATFAEVEAQRARLRSLAQDCGLVAPRLRRDGTVIVHDSGPGYRAVSRFSGAASRLVGAYVHVVTDDVVGSRGDAEPL